MNKYLAILAVTFSIVLAACGSDTSNTVPSTSSVETSVIVLEQKPVDKQASSEDQKSGSSLDLAGTITYTAQKQWLSRPTEPVNGSTSAISGSAVINENTASITVAFDGSTLKSGSEGRDQEVANLFAAPINIAGENIDLNQKQADLDVEINGVQKTLPFNVEIIKTANGYEASGSSTLNMTDFNLEPFSVLNLYTVDEVIEVAFDVTAK